MRLLSKAQDERLTRGVLTGDFSGGSWLVIKALLNRGLIEEVNRRLVPTKAGRDYVEWRHQMLVAGTAGEQLVLKIQGL